ncbi:MAG TPA: hypothetical protein VMF69_22515 [Gemmataceae bacterium]|nr:hypothetical protein [Gemmataceae bacterium]
MAPAAPAQRLPLPPDEQVAVNHAIDHGVAYLKRTQQKNGTWADPRMNWKGVKFHEHFYAVGFTALPALTLLECGVPASDPIVQQAARFVRSQAAKVEWTYELSLALLFLDRLGDPKDEKLIQTFALRLIGGQSATGGWGYKCPVFNDKLQSDLLTALRHLDPPADGMPDLARGAGKKPGAPGLKDDIARPAAPSLSGDISRGSPGESPPPQDSIAEPPDRGRDGPDLGMLEKKNPEQIKPDAKAPAEKKPPPIKADGKTEKGKAADAKAEERKSSKPYVIPKRISMLPVAQDPDMLILQDPADQRMVPIRTTTDNSNTQFAILALWRAQHYDVPVRRSLNLIFRRYLTSQNANGSWNYHYYFGGANQLEFFTSAGAMTCAGLIGLAVGHGLAQPQLAGQPVQDPRIVNGLTALSTTVGQPVEQPGKLPMQNLYYLWSLERVAVLYNLATIGDKDWYRWGAQILVRNQEIDGNWTNGLYIGSNPPLDTCLALLFLKRANLVKDLTAKLPFTAANLNSDIREKLEPKKTPAPAKKPKKPLPPVEPPKPEELEKTITVAKTQTPIDDPEPESKGSGGKTKWIVLFAVVFLMLSAGSLFFILLAVKRRKEGEAEEKQTKRGKRSVSRDPKGSAGAARSPSGRG